MRRSLTDVIIFLATTATSSDQEHFLLTLISRLSLHSLNNHRQHACPLGYPVSILK